ncbi:MAG TPA: glycosyltransferase, partial [Cyclobacteriaceae bacterium]
TYVEALAAGVPSVFSISGVAREFIVNESNALIVKYENSNEIFKGLIRILTNEDLRTRLIINGRLSVMRRFDLQVMINSLIKIYSV